MRSGITRRWLRGNLLITVLLVLLAEAMFLHSYTRSYYNGVQQTMYRRFSSITGQLKINGREVHLKNERSAIEAGLAYVTEDRKDNGLVLIDTIAVNNTMARLEKVCNRGIIDIDQENQVAEDYRRKLATKTPSVQQAVGNLSGGNQQKVLLAKWMFADPDVLIVDEPTRGIDVGAKYEIYCIMNDLIAQGKSIIMISSEMPELLGMCDRIYVMNEGSLVGEFPIEEATQEKIMAAILQSGKKEESKGVLQA